MLFLFSSARKRASEGFGVALAMQHLCPWFANATFVPWIANATFVPMVCQCDICAVDCQCNICAHGLPMRHLCCGLPMRHLCRGLPMRHLCCGLPIRHLFCNERDDCSGHFLRRSFDGDSQQHLWMIGFKSRVCSVRWVDSTGLFVFRHGSNRVNPA